MPNLNYTGAVINTSFGKTIIQGVQFITKEIATNLNYKHIQRHIYNLGNPKRSTAYKHPSMYVCYNF